MQSEKKMIEKLFNNKILLGILLLALCGPYMLTRDMEETKHIYEFVTSCIACTYKSAQFVYAYIVAYTRTAIYIARAITRLTQADFTTAYKSIYEPYKYGSYAA